jgi:hypothetical protein
MTQRRSTVATACVLAVLTLIAPGIAAGQTPKTPESVPEQVQWKLERLHKEPFRLIKATPDPATGQVRFLIEFTRNLELAELFDWEQRGGPVVFRFLDADGVVIRTVKPRLEGEVIANKGTRIRLVLQLPDERTLSLTRSITVD